MEPTRFLPTLFAAVVGGCAALLPPASEPVPGPLVPAGETPRLSLSARGVQIYECRRLDGMQPAWLFLAPEARLYDARGEAVGSHGAGPHWQAEDGSRIVGTVVAKVVPQDDDAVPWLLLHTRGAGGEGRFSGITSVQRIHTRGGTAPARRCDETALGRTERVPYTADYVFFEGGRS
ncbi:MAG: DUF3455 domain-containing protein [Burkholderiales bacterium]|nr:DUF3455 domain-containing protein [Burkholderiales bacterium]